MKGCHLSASHEATFFSYKRPPLNLFSFYFSKTLLFFVPSKNPSFLSSTFTHLATAHVLLIASPGSQISSFRGISYGAIFEFENGFLRFFEVI